MENNQPIETDEIDLLEIVAKLWKRKWTIVLITIIPTLLMVAYALINIKRVELYNAQSSIKIYPGEYASGISFCYNSEDFIEKIQERYPNLLRENFDANTDNASFFTVYVTSKNKEIVSPVAQYATEIIDSLFKNKYYILLETQNEKKNYQKKLKIALQNSIDKIEKNAKLLKNSDDLIQLTLAISSADNAYNNLNFHLPDYKKTSVLQNAKNPKLSIQEKEKLSKKKKQELSKKGTSKTVLTLVTFFICFFLSVFLVLAADFIKNNKEKFKEYLKK